PTLPYPHPPQLLGSTLRTGSLAVDSPANGQIPPGPRRLSLMPGTVIAVLYRLLADGVVVIHFAYLAFIPVGGFLAWRWPRVRPFHLAACAVAAVSITVGFDCPLTAWERWLRRRGGQQAYHGGFIDHYLTGKLYPHGYATVAQ